jgi:hypothetical protein
MSFIYYLLIAGGCIAVALIYLVVKGKREEKKWKGRHRRYWDNMYVFYKEFPETEIDYPELQETQEN